MGNDVALILGESRHAGALGDVLANESIGVLVAAAFPGVVRSGEIEGDAGGFFNLVIGMELGAVVGGDGLESPGVLHNKSDGPLIQFFFGAGLELPDQHEACAALDQRNDTVQGASHDGVDLPVTAAGAFCRRLGALRDMALAGESAPAVVAAVALAPLLAGTAQFPVQHATLGPVAPDISIDRLVADRELACQVEIT